MRATLAVAVLLYASSIYVSVLPPLLVVPMLLGLVCGRVGPRAPLVAGGAWLAGCTLAPPQWLVTWVPWTAGSSTGFFYEPRFVEAFNQQLTGGPGWWFAGATLGAATAWAVARRAWLPPARRRLGWLLAGLAALNFLARAQTLAPALADDFRREPPAQSYAFDATLHLKVVHLLRQQEGYYQATERAFAQDRRSYADREFHTVRFPLLLEMLARLPDPGWIVGAARLAAALLLLSSYAVAARRGDPWLALSVPFLLSAWLLFAVTTPCVIFHDNWSVGLALGGFCLYLSRWRRSGIALLCLAVLVRELAVVTPVLGLALSWWRRDRREAALWALGVGMALALLALHNHFTAHWMDISMRTAFLRRWDGTLLTGLRTLTFGSVCLAGRDLLMFPLLLLATVALPWRTRPDPGCRLLALVVAVHFLLNCRLGNQFFLPHYGLNYTPLLLLGAGLSLVDPEQAPQP